MLQVLPVYNSGSRLQRRICTGWSTALVFSCTDFRFSRDDPQCLKVNFQRSVTSVAFYRRNRLFFPLCLDHVATRPTCPTTYSGWFVPFLFLFFVFSPRNNAMRSDEKTKYRQAKRRKNASRKKKRINNASRKEEIRKSAT